MTTRLMNEMDYRQLIKPNLDNNNNNDNYQDFSTIWIFKRKNQKSIQKLEDKISNLLFPLLLFWND